MKQRKLPMDSLPENEQGVVFLFAEYARHHRLRVRKIRATYPDAEVIRRDATGEKPIRVEFEFRASNFLRHRHNPKDCDWIVCWENDLATKPVKNIIALNEYYGYARNVWLGNSITGRWTAHTFLTRVVSKYPVDHRAKVGDLVLVSRSWGYGECKERGLPREEGLVTRIVAVARIEEITSRKYPIEGRLRRLVRFENPLRWEHVVSHPSVGEIVGDKITHCWPEVIRRLGDLCPASSSRLKKLC